ncbi:hypothetical protein Tco_0888348, partial [Tanacetum coccineum]
MSSNSDDIQAAGSNNCPPMLDRTDYDSWSQRIRLYYRGKENGIYILQSIDHGPFKLGTTRDTLGTTPEGSVLLGPERPRTYDDLNDNDKKLFDADVPKAIWDNVKMLLAGSKLTKEDRESQLYDEFERFKMLSGENINEYYVRFHKLVNDIRNIRMTMPNIQLNSKFVNNMSPEWDRMFKGGRIRLRETLLGELVQREIGEHIIELGMPMQDKMLLMQAQENGAVLDEEDLLFLAGEQTNTFDADVDNQAIKYLALNEDNIFQADECDAFDSDVDDEPTAQSIFMANLSSARLTNLQAGLSNASILSEVHDMENAIDPSNNNQVEHEIHNEVRQKKFIDSTSANMGNSNVIPYEQYLMVNDVSVITSSASSVSNDAYMLHDNDVYVPHDPLVTERAHNPFYPRKAKQAQPALYDGDELLKTHHVPVIVTSSEEDLELAETTRIKMNDS